MKKKQMPNVVGTSKSSQSNCRILLGPTPTTPFFVARCLWKKNMMMLFYRSDIFFSYKKVVHATFFNAIFYI